MNNDEFQNLLLKMIDIDDDNDDSNEQRTCLISGDKLENNHITLACGHKFNFYNIYNEVIKQKCQENYNETQHLKNIKLNVHIVDLFKIIYFHKLKGMLLLSMLMHLLNI